MDVAAANGVEHLLACTGFSSEAAARARYAPPEMALIEMGDFAGAVLKRLRQRAFPRVTLAGGFGKLSKLAQGRLDLHSRHGGVDFAFLAAEAAALGGGNGLGIEQANTAAQVLEMASAARLPLAAHIARLAAQQASAVARCPVEILVVGRDGGVLAAEAGA